MKAQDYRAQAAECLRLMDETADPGAKAVLVDMAQVWLRLAELAEKSSQTDLVYETPPRRRQATEPPT